MQGLDHVNIIYAGSVAGICKIVQICQSRVSSHRPNPIAPEVNLGIVPYYMFLARDTGAQSFFSVPLAEAHDAGTWSISGPILTVWDLW